MGSNDLTNADSSKNASLVLPLKYKIQNMFQVGLGAYKAKLSGKFTPKKHKKRQSVDTKKAR